jgi:hypothetical protein
VWDALLRDLEESAVAEFFRQSLWLYPAVEIVHIVGFATLVGAAFVLDARLLGWLRALPLSATVHGLSRGARWSLCLVLPSGLILFIVEATTLAANPAFRLKIVLLLAAAANAAVFHRLVFPRLGAGDETLGRAGAAHSPPARLAGLLSIVLWISVIACGRLIAYT